jgi:serine/threonine protein phosphatase PrpC
MEDVHIVLPAGSWDNADMTYLAIYDGHGGRDMVDFLQHSLHHNIAFELRDMGQQGRGDCDKCDDDDEKSHLDDVAQRLERAFLATDIQAHKFGIHASGSTVALCLIHHEARTLYTANVGDARIVLGCTDPDQSASMTKSEAVLLSHDHRADDPVEMKRIDKAGGFCLKGRVVGVLAVARSLGDFGLKKYVIAKPHTQTHTLISKSDPEEHASNHDQYFVVLACDGLWDVITVQEAVDLVRKTQRPKHQVADELIQHALQRGTTDNVTVIVCWL